MYVFVKFDCKDLKQYDFPFMDNTIIEFELNLNFESSIMIIIQSRPN